jgi:hypothetical protein
LRFTRCCCCCYFSRSYLWFTINCCCYFSRSYLWFIRCWCWCCFPRSYLSFTIYSVDADVVFQKVICDLQSGVVGIVF